MKKNKIISVFALIIYIVGFVPAEGVCSENDSNIENMARELLVCAETGSEAAVLHKIRELEVCVEDAPNTFEKTRKFIQSFVEEINLRYGMCLTVADACLLVKDNLERFQLPQNLQEDFLIALNFYASQEATIPPSSSQEILEEMHRLHSGVHFHPPWKWNFFGLNKPKHSKFKKHLAVTKKCANKELELPGKLAMGFACVLAGALLCIIPFGQGSGLLMIGTGTALAFEGLDKGERPYYKDTETGEITPFGDPQ